ncbi:MAG: helix-turn-helix transcriptional regulator [Alphaproteobacteria bacterium]
MRYEKSENISRLAIKMQSNAEGLSLADIQNEFGVSRRTAERMRDAVLRLYPQYEEIIDGRSKRWRIPYGRVNNPALTVDELSSIAKAIKLAEEIGREDIFKHLKSAQDKIKATISPDAIRKAEPDIEAIIEAEGYAMRPEPKEKIDTHILETLVYAIKACRKVKVEYLGANSGKISFQVIYPYGFTYGSRKRLVLYNEYAEDFYTYRLANIKKIKLLDECFKKDANFSLKKYVEQSFGAFQEPPQKVVWRASPEIADDAKNWLFHPTQTIEEQADGSLLITFIAGGFLEMAWHLYTWDGKMEVLEPKVLRDMIDF